MRIVHLGVYRQWNGKVVRLAHAYHLTPFSYFTRGTIQEHIVFAARTVVERTPAGARATIATEDEQNPFQVHIYVRTDGLAAVVVADKEYNPRVAFGLVYRTLTNYEQSNAAWREIVTDQNVEPDYLRRDIADYQDPTKTDQLAKIQVSLDEVKGIAAKNIEQLLQRGEKLEDLMQKSEDLSLQSVQFYKQAKKANRCCRI